MNATVPRGAPLPVLHRHGEGRRFCAYTGIPYVRLTLWHGVLMVVTFVLMTTAAGAQFQTYGSQLGVVATLIKWTPLLWQGFLLNLVMSIIAMTVGTLLGALLGLGQVSLLAPIRVNSWILTQIFRNSPWLVLLFYVMYLMPFEVTVFGTTIPLPDWMKATFGFSLPVMANVSEIVRGGIRSIPQAQWEAARALAFARRQILWMIIIPQCLKRMLPPWMNLYAILTMGTVLANIVGVSEALTMTREVLASEHRGELLLPFYGYILIWFFIYIFPIARLTVRLERKWAVAT